jgi:hypothetical protein
VTKKNKSPSNSGFFLGANDVAWAATVNLLIADGITFSYIVGAQSGLDALDDTKNIVTQEVVNLYRGIISNSPDLKEHRVDADILDLYSHAEQVCMEICDRMDQSYSFSRVERERLYIDALEYWLFMVDDLDPHFIVMTETPHSVYEYVLYAIAKQREIPIQMFVPIAALRRVLPYQDYMAMGSEVLETYKEYCARNSQMVELPKDLQEYVDRHHQSYDEVIPDYLKKRLDDLKRVGLKTRLVIYGKKLCKLHRYPRYLHSFIDSCSVRVSPVIKGLCITKTLNRNYLKMPSEALELTEGLDRRQWNKYKRRAGKYKAQLKKIYDNYSQVLDERVKFVYVPLQFQPERTSSPEGGRYSNQLLMIRLIASVLPRGWEIVVKENPSQLLSNTMHGERGRYAYYYDDLATIPNVRIVPVDTNQFTLIDKSVAVATLTGTTGWEAIMRAKPVLCFGYAWYIGCDGVMRITNRNDCSIALENIRNGVVIDMIKVHCFLAALDKHSFCGFLKLKRYENIEFGKRNNMRHLVPIIKKFIGYTESPKVL